MKLYETPDEMFAAFDADLEAAIARAASHFELHPDFVRYYVEHLCHEQRDNPQAHAYFESEFGLFRRTLESLQALCAAQAFDLSGAAVLDVGCSSGHSLRVFERLGARRAVGLEYDPQRHATSCYMLECHGSGAEVYRGSILDPDFVARHEGAFDLVTCFDVLEHIPSAQQAIAHFARLLRPGGRAIVTIGNRHHPDMMLREPHYGLPGMTLLDSKSARRYHDLVREGEYEVFEWLTRAQLERLFRRNGMTPLAEPLVEVEGIEARVREALDLLWDADYPSPGVRRRVRLAILRTRWRLASTRDPGGVFGLALLTVSAIRPAA